MQCRNDSPLLGRAAIGLAIAYIWIYLLQIAIGAAAAVRAQHLFGLVPAVLTGRASLAAGLDVLPPTSTLLTSPFLHDSAAQVIGVLFYLWMFAARVEAAMGAWRFVVLALTAGVCAGLAQTVAVPLSIEPLLGARGVVSGVLGAHLLLVPRARFALPPSLGLRLPTVPAALLLLGWFALPVLHALTGDHVQPIWVGDAGGFVCGLILVLFLKRPGTRLFA
jgi:membrane associated rhomboid family serine protease